MWSREGVSPHQNRQKCQNRQKRQNRQKCAAMLSLGQLSAVIGDGQKPSKPPKPSNTHTHTQWYTPLCSILKEKRYEKSEKCHEKSPKMLSLVRLSEDLIGPFHKIIHGRFHAQMKSSRPLQISRSRHTKPFRFWFGSFRGSLRGV